MPPALDRLGCESNLYPGILIFMNCDLEATDFVSVKPITEKSWFNSVSICVKLSKFEFKLLILVFRLSRE